MKLLSILLVVHGLCAVTASIRDASSTAGAAAGISDAHPKRQLWSLFFRSPTPAPTSASVERPSERPLVKCSWWCPNGYTRRDATIGPTCSFFTGGFGKCVDNQKRYLGEGCDDRAHSSCSGSLVCKSVAQGSAESHACACSKTCQRPGAGGRQLLGGGAEHGGATAAAPQVAARRLTAASRRRMLRAFGEVRRRRLVGRSTEYCREDAPMGLGGDCFATFRAEKNTLKACSLASLNAAGAAGGPAPCLCDAGAKRELRACDLESGSLRSADYKIAHCADRVEYIARGASSGVSVCKRYVEHDRFAALGLTRTRALACTSAWWKYGCCAFQSGYAWRNGRCEAVERNLGEECGDEWGVCKNPGESYDGHRLSCAVDSAAPGGKARCVPSLYDITRNQCSCAWFSWYLGFACGSNDCNGHGCVWNTGDGNYYCDYNTKNDW